MTLYIAGWCDVIGVAAESSTSIIDVAVTHPQLQSNCRRRRSRQLVITSSQQRRSWTSYAKLHIITIIDITVINKIRDMTFEMHTDSNQSKDILSALPAIRNSTSGSWHIKCPWLNWHFDCQPIIMTFQPSSIWDPTFVLSTQMSFTNKCQPLTYHIIHTALRNISSAASGQKIWADEKIFTN